MREEGRRVKRAYQRCGCHHVFAPLASPRSPRAVVAENNHWRFDNTDDLVLAFLRRAGVEAIEMTSPPSASSTRRPSPPRARTASTSSWRSAARHSASRRSWRPTRACGSARARRWRTLYRRSASRTRSASTTSSTRQRPRPAGCSSSSSTRCPRATPTRGARAAR